MLDVLVLFQVGPFEAAMSMSGSRRCNKNKKYKGSSKQKIDEFGRLDAIFHSQMSILMGFSIVLFACFFTLF